MLSLFASARRAALSLSFAVVGGLASLPAHADRLDPVFAPPTEAERQAVLADWKSRSQPVRNWQVVDQVRDEGYRLDIVSHELDGNRHFAAVRTPENYRPGRSTHPILVLNHGGWEGADADWALHVNQDCLSDFFVIVPSFRGEPLRLEGRRYMSTGRQSLIDRDVDDTMALISGVLAHYPGAQDDDVSAWGYSRGGGTSLLLGIRDPRVDRVVNVFGPTDVLTHEDMIEGVRQTLAGDDWGPFYRFPAQWVDAHLSGRMSLGQVRKQLLAGSALHFADLLPERVQTHHGARDTIVPVENARALDAALNERSNMTSSQYFEYPFGGHGELRGLDRRAIAMLCEDR